MINRSIKKNIQAICFPNKKMAFISGPRQVGKTTLSKQLAGSFSQSQYLTWDNPKIRKQWMTDPTTFVAEFNHNKPALLVVDEIHKSKLWKTQLKGLWDQRPSNLDMVVTGSAQLNTLKKAGDSLLGRYYHFHLHPLTIGEIFEASLPPEELLVSISKNDYTQRETKFNAHFENLKKFSGFPEPFLAANQRQLNLWRKSRLDRLIREDLRDLSQLPDLSSVEILASLLPDKVGSSLSVENLRLDLESSHNTIKRWLIYLEAVYYQYTLRPYSNKISNSIRREPKIYLYDYTEVKNAGALFENMIANHLYKTCHIWTDSGYGHFELQYVKTKQHVEIDFLITLNKKPWLAIETKKTNQKISTPVMNLLSKLNCPLVMLSENEITPAIFRFEKHFISHVSINRFLPLLG